MAREAQTTDGLLQVRNLSKSFTGVKALDHIRLDIEKGRVHALAGENGAGKSTLMKILSGVYPPDAGEIKWKGNPIRLKNPGEAMRVGIAMIHQERLPFRDMSVAENICMGQEPVRYLPGWLDRAAMNQRAAQWLERLGLSIPPNRKMKELSAAEMQMVEIAKALACRAEVMIMDEPTSSLSGREIGALLAIIDELKSRGVAVIYISHKLDEIFRVADTVTVLRDGCQVATAGIHELDENGLIALMVGRERGPITREPSAEKGPEALAVSRFSKPGKFQEVSFSVHYGEVLGVTGLVGAGRTELVFAIVGLISALSGEIRMAGKPVRITGPGAARAHGIVLVSEDRKVYGLVSTMSVKHNITLASLKSYQRCGFIDHQQEDRIAGEQIRALSIKTAGPDQRVDGLSGGNQQKVILAGALLTHPSILILDEPTRGMDIGAKAEVYDMIRRLAHQGKAIIMVSSEIPEILALSDRILVMRQGRLSAELDPYRTSPEEILKWAMPEGNERGNHA